MEESFGWHSALLTGHYDLAILWEAMRRFDFDTVLMALMGRVFAEATLTMLKDQGRQ